MRFAGLDAVEGGVEHGWSVACHGCHSGSFDQHAFWTDAEGADSEWCRSSVRPAMLRMMAGGAGHVTGGGEDGIKEQQAAERNLRRGVGR